MSEKDFTLTGVAKKLLEKVNSHEVSACLLRAEKVRSVYGAGGGQTPCGHSYIGTSDQSLANIMAQESGGDPDWY